LGTNEINVFSVHYWSYMIRNLKTETQLQIATKSQVKKLAPTEF
jgi:hypothetical protein